MVNRTMGISLWCTTGKSTTFDELQLRHHGLDHDGHIINLVQGLHGACAPTALSGP